MPDRTITALLVAEYRPRMFGLAYRMLGGVADAEDVVQEAFLRWARADRSSVENPGGWLLTVVSRICLDRLKSAYRQRETYIGPWLPEPVATDDLDPASSADMADSLNLAFLVLLERLSPAERAAFLLHDVFGYRHHEVAAMLERSPGAVRQLASRARAHLAAHRPRYDSDSNRRRQAATAFVAAAAGADLDQLMSVLAPDVTFVADGGGTVAATRHPVHGVDRVAQVIMQLARHARPDWSIERRAINRSPGIVVRRGDRRPEAVWVLQVADGLIATIQVIRNPVKLRGFAGIPPGTTALPIAGWTTDRARSS